MQQGELLKQGTRVPHALEETTASPGLGPSPRPGALGIVSCLQSNLRTQRCPVCQRQFPHLSGNKPTDPKAQFHKKQIADNELSAGSLHCTSLTIMINSISVLIVSGIQLQEQHSQELPQGSGTAGTVLQGNKSRGLSFLSAS